MINYVKESRLSGFKYSIIEFYNKNKLLIFIIGILLLVALLTGIFTSIKLYNIDSDIDLSDYSIYSLIDGSVYSFSYILLRFLSVAIIALLLFVFSLSNWVAVFGFCLIVYRGYLITLNCTFVIIKSGITGIFFPLVIVLLAQLLLIALLCILFILFLNIAKEKKICGSVSIHQKRKIIYILLAVLIISLLETLLLLLFRPTTILII